VRGFSCVDAACCVVVRSVLLVVPVVKGCSKPKSNTCVGLTWCWADEDRVVGAVKDRADAAVKLAARCGGTTNEAPRRYGTKGRCLQLHFWESSTLPIFNRTLYTNSWASKEVKPIQTPQTSIEHNQKSSTQATAQSHRG